MNKNKYIEALKTRPKTAPKIVKSITDKNGMYGSEADFRKNNIDIINEAVTANTK